MEARKKILVVDDEFDIREMLIDFLNFSGYDVVTTTNGKEGVDAFQNESFDAALIDIKMPVMSGIACARAIKKIKPDFPIIIMTGHLESYSQEEIDSIGIEELILKPLDILEIEKLLKKYL